MGDFVRKTATDFPIQHRHATTMRSSPDSLPLYRQVADKLEKLIHTGAMRPGDRVPSVRKACAQHRVSLSTILKAYSLLEDNGLIETRPKSGFFVKPQIRDRVPEPRTSNRRPSAKRVSVSSLQARLFDAARLPEVAPLGAAYPGADCLPGRKLSRIMASVARNAVAPGINYDMPPGSERLRREIAKRSLDRGLNLSPDEIITTCGGTEALALCLRAVTKPGDLVAVETPAYFGVLQLIEELNLKALEVPMHPREGMDLDLLEQALAGRRVAACLAVPNFSNPLGSLMPDEHKERLAAILARHRVPLIEDDVNGGLHHREDRPRVALSYDRQGRGMLCGSFSKTLAPGYRVGWVVPGRHFDKVKALKLTSTLATPSLPQLAIAEFMANGGYEHHLRSLRRNFANQISEMRNAIVAAFPEPIKLTRPAGGFVLWVELPKTVSALALHERALAEKISIAPGPMFSATQRFRNFIRVNCGHRWSRDIERAIDILGRLVKRLM